VDSDCITGRCSFGFCESEAGPAVTAPETPSEEAKEPFSWARFLLTWGLVILGLALIGGGSGYLAYTKRGAPAPAPPVGLPTARIPRQGVPLPPRMIPQEQEAMLHRQARIREKVEKERAKKEEEREETLARFGKPIPKAKKMIPEKEARPALPTEEWVSLEELGKKKAPAPAMIKPEDVDFEKLEKISRKEEKEEDIFERLPAKKRKAEEEDVFAKLPEKRARESELATKIEVDRLEELGKKIGGDIFEELGKKGAKKGKQKK